MVEDPIPLGEGGSHIPLCLGCDCEFVMLSSINNCITILLLDHKNKLFRFNSLNMTNALLLSACSDMIDLYYNVNNDIFKTDCVYQ